jgi:RES domain-containing protein
VTDRYVGPVYRALNPIYARDPLSGRGAERYGGRFNPRGVPALYTSLSIMTAIREANQVGSLQPTMLVSYAAEIERVFDARDTDALAEHRVTPADLSAPTWRDEMRADGIARTQVFAIRLMSAGFHGLLVRSFAAGTTADDMNLVLWRWGDAAPHRLRVIDDDGRLARLVIA